MLVRLRYVHLFSLLLTFFFSHALQAECRRRSLSEQPLPEDLTSVDIEKLLSFDLEVTSPQKKIETFSDTSSAIFIITHEDIRRSGVTHVAEALRLAPGINVARIDNNRWAISARGFNKTFANKLLVLLDGQRIFSPQFNGVWWDQFNLLPEDIDRIEVIRGPGASMWGPNAVNGVINIITCDARETTGVQATVASGNQERLIASLSAGDSVGENGAYRIYGRVNNRDSNILASGESAYDGADNARGGIRFDSQITKQDVVTLKADGYFSDKELEVTVPSFSPPFVDSDTFSDRKEVYGTNMLGKWEHEISSTSLVSTQLDYTFERQKGVVFPIHRHTANLEVFHRFEPFKYHEFMYGVEYRYYEDDFEGTFADDFDPESRTTNTLAGFIHDEITLIDDELDLILGSKFEENPFVGFQFMPTARFVFTPDKSQTIWGAVSRAVSTPSRVEEDVVVPTALIPPSPGELPALVTLYGNNSFQSEKVLAYELGYRSRVTQDLSLDIALFYNDYHDLISNEPGAPAPGMLLDQPEPAVLVPVSFENQHAGYAYGGEVAVEWQAKSWWRIVSTYSFIDLNLSQGSSMDDFNITFFSGTTPRHQANVRSHIDVTENLEFDAILRFVDTLDYGNIDAYTELDLRVAYDVTSQLELSVVGQNLLDSSHEEFSAVILPPSSTVSLRRGVYAQAAYLF